MKLIAIVLSLALATFMLLSGILKFTKPPRIRAFADAVHLSDRQLAYLGSIQLLGVVGLLAGFVYLPFAVAAATGFVLYFLGALVAHARAHDPQIGGAVAFLVLSSFVVGALVATQA